MMDCIAKLKNKIIVSVQAQENEPLYDEKCITALALSAISGGAGGLRLAGSRDIKNLKSLTNLPIIGITKPSQLPQNWLETVYITPTYSDANLIADAGADIIAMDATLRKRKDESLDFIAKKIKSEIKKPIMADISTFEEGIKAVELGFDIISTTLSGYTAETATKNNEEPDFELLEKLTKNLDCPIILEGRVWIQEHVKKAFDLGAFAVVVGSAITRPQLITKRFVEAIK